MSQTAADIEHLDVIIVGAGISGIGAAYYLQRDHPTKSYAILEARADTGGTWDLFRYPGIRSDSDLFTFGYEFKPWHGDAIASADKILAYLRDTATENGIDAKVRSQHKVRAAHWSSAAARWVVDVERTDTGERLQLAARWLFVATGYYRYDEGFTPHFEGRERFQGQVVHPQHWPEDLDYTGKKVVVIGSGATAVTLVPAMASSAAHVTMLQRSPTYIVPLPAKDSVATTLMRLLGESRGFGLARRKNIAQLRNTYRFCRRFPRLSRRILRHLNAAQLPKGYPVDVHFNPSYEPWDQRLCVVPDADLFRAISAGDASVVTDRITRFTENGIELESGQHLEADIIVTATGLNLVMQGGISLTVDGEPVHLADRIAFKGMMLSGVPNYAFALGYFNVPWTLRVGLVCQHFCRLLAEMDKLGHDICCPNLHDHDLGMDTRPLMDFAAGYLQRAADHMPRQGFKRPWVLPPDYHDDAAMLQTDAVRDPNLTFSRSSTPPARQPADVTATA